MGEALAIRTDESYTLAISCLSVLTVVREFRRSVLCRWSALSKLWTARACFSPICRSHVERRHRDFTLSAIANASAKLAASLSVPSVRSFVSSAAHLVQLKSVTSSDYSRHETILRS